MKGDAVGSIIEYVSDFVLFGRCFDVIIRRNLDLDPMIFTIEIYFEDPFFSIPKYVSIPSPKYANLKGLPS
jgi:hypothetical protein